jgi:hypothetical protein
MSDRPKLEDRKKAAAFLNELADVYQAQASAQTERKKVLPPYAREQADIDNLISSSLETAARLQHASWCVLSSQRPRSSSDRGERGGQAAPPRAR